MRRLLLLATILLLFLAYPAWKYWRNHRDVPVDRRHSAIWMAHRWFGKSPPLEEARTTAEHLAGLGFTDLYFHCGPLDAKGNIPAWKAAQWKPVLEQFRRSIPGLRAYAWVGGVTVEGYGVAPDTVDMSNPKVRQGIVRTCQDLVKRGGFDGIHYDLEPTPDGSQGFLKLAEETRILPAQLSVAFAVNWKPPYLLQVAQRCDQVALMAYDLGESPSPEAYSALLARLVPVLCETLSSTHCRFIMGVPAYPPDPGTTIHNVTVENISTATTGILAGLRNSPDYHSFQGIGVYAHWTSTEKDWQMLKDLWLR